MPDTRLHRGPHPQDRELFSPQALKLLRPAVRDLSWLLSRGYSEYAALKLVGDHYQLRERQRVAVRRCSCSDEDLHVRKTHLCSPIQLSGETVALDGFNVITSIEAALGGGVILCGLDGVYRDMASVHRSYKRVQETVPAVEMIIQALTALGVKSADWYLDKPISNSGRLAAIIRERTVYFSLAGGVKLVPDADRFLKQVRALIISADGVILSKVSGWFNLVNFIIDSAIPTAWVCDLR